jgi:hypothetical protein
MTLRFAFAAALCLLPLTLQAMPHMDLEMTGQEYRALLKKRPSAANVLQQAEAQFSPEDALLKTYIEFGERNLRWLDLVNKNRAESDKLSLTSEATTNGYPVDNARMLNFAVIEAEWLVLRALLPDSMKRIVFDGEPATEVLPVTEREFIEWGRQIDNAYQHSARLTMLKPYKAELTEYAAFDVRGYLKLNRPDIDTTLSNWANLSENARISLSDALMKICRNSEMIEVSCRSHLQKTITDNNVPSFRKNYWQRAEANYDSFFTIPKTRKDAVWNTQNPNVMRIPFADPQNEIVKNFLESNIEDEFNWLGWTLDLEFIQTKSPNTTHIVFEAGATPNVNDLAGSIITMDGNAPLTEYDVQWTIRHEYGHVLGLPDCYFEFYDEAVEAFVSYQLDITNLMCSRRGHFQQKHFDELKRVYYK